MYSHKSSAAPVLSSSGIRYFDWVMSNSPSSSTRRISHTRRFVPPMSRARKVPSSWPVGKPITQVTFIGYWGEEKETILPSIARSGGGDRGAGGGEGGEEAHDVPTLDAEACRSQLG